MATSTLERSFKELVTAIVSTDDPSLLERACAALDIILANYADSDDARN